ncbi:MAG: hypothetical protein Q8R29_03560 [bacterium]|nr:hypothetical protein [bacterium]
MKNFENQDIPDLKGVSPVGSDTFEGVPDRAETPVKTKEEPKKWTPEEEQEIRKKAYDIFEKRMRGEIPADKTDKILEDNGITPWTPEAQKFMEKWDWQEAEKEYAQMKGANKEEKKEDPKVEPREEPKKEETVEAVKIEPAPAEVTPEAMVAAGVAPEVVALPEQVADNQKAIEAEIAKLPEEVRQGVGFSLSNIGYWMERGKGERLAAMVKWAEGKIDPKERGFTDRFLSAIWEKSVRDAEVADKKMEDIEKGRRRTLGNVGYVGKNVYNVARPVADVIGWTATLPLRYVSILAAGAAVTSDMLKEARLKSEKAIEKTRIQDADEAIEEAKRVYEKAGGIYDSEKGGNGVGVEALKKAYQEDIPVSLKDRLRNNPEAGLISKISNGFFTWHIEKSVNNLNKKIGKIESRTDWHKAKKDYEKERVFNNYRKRLNDFDRMLGQAGAVDTLAMLGKYGDYAGKTVVAGTALLMLKPAFDKFWDWMAGGAADKLPDIVGENGPSWEELLGIDLKDGLDENEAKKILKYMLERIEAKDGATAQQMIDRYGKMEVTGLGMTFEEWLNGILFGAGETPKTTVPWEDLIDNKGIIGHDSIWQSTKHIVEAHAREMGYTGDLNDVTALDKWAETQTANLVNTLAEAQGGRVKDLVHGGPDIGGGKYDKVFIYKVGGKWVLDFKAESGIEPGFLPAGQAGLPEAKVAAVPVAPETPPAEIPLPESAPEPVRSDLEKAFEALSGEKERQAFVYNYLLNESKTTGLNLSNEKAWAFSRTFGKTMSYIDTPDELREALTNFDRQLGFTKDVLVKDELPVSDKIFFVAENAKGQIFDLEHPSKDVYRVIKQLPDGKSQYIGHGWLNKKDWDLGSVKSFLGYK